MIKRSVVLLVLALEFCLPLEAAETGEVRGTGMEMGSLVLEGPANPARHVEALGERGGIWGSIGGGFEAWAYPFKMFDSLTVTVVDGKGERSEELFDTAQVQVAAPHLAQLKCSGADWKWTATFFYPRSTEGGVILFEVDSPEALEFRIRFRPSLAPMLLAREGQLARKWDGDRKEIVFQDEARGAELRVGSPAAVRSEVGRDGRETLWLQVPGGSAGRRQIALKFAMGWEQGPSAPEIMDRLETRLSSLLKAALRHYEGLLMDAPRVTSPDKEVNAALAWSVVSLDQFRVHNPFLGYGLVSGFSSSGNEDNPRPRYCWFFEEPTLASWAFHRVGLSRHVAEALRFLQRYQRSDGKTVHEVTQSLKYDPGFLQTSPFAYNHSDGPVYYLLAYGHYYRSTGDAGFIRDEWHRIKRTLEWCFSMTDPADGLMTIERGEWGSAESSTRVWKDTQLEGMWVRALDETGRLAKLMGDAGLASRCSETRGRAMESIEEKLWDETAGNYVWGINREGGRLGSFVPHQSLSYWLSSFRTDRVVRALSHLAGSEFRSDWGVRTLSASDADYDPASYQKGSVWPVWNAGVIVSDYRYGRSAEAYRNWRVMVRLRTLESLGPMPEVLNGEKLHRLKEGVPHQMFSEVALVNGFYDGLLGLEVDVPGGMLKLAPTMPPTWEKLDVERIPVGDGRLNVGLERNLELLRLHLELAEAGPMELHLAPRLPEGASVSAVLIDGERAAFRLESGHAGLRTALVIPSFEGKRVVEIRFSGGIEMMPLDAPLEAGGVSQGLRVIRSGLTEGIWTMAVEGLPDRVYPVQLFTRRVPLRALGAALTDKTVRGFRVQLKAPQGSVTNAVGYARWETSVQFQGN